jgi:molybdopterin synthase sulfur carrier subunit
MPKIRVKLFANFREFTHTKELELEGETVREILDSLCNRFAGLEILVFKNGIVRPYINIFINGNNINESGGLEQELHTGDELAIFPPVSGG